MSTVINPVLAFADLDLTISTPYLLFAVLNTIAFPLAIPPEVSEATTREFS
ncbi:hypothetical protein D3C78_1846560 [compost metagenome]